MRPLIFTLSLLSFFINSLFAQGLSFSRTHGGDHYDDARSIVATDDGGYAFTGLNKSRADTLGDMYLTKINAAGAILWEKSYGLPEEDGGNFLMKTDDGGFIISGHTAFTYGSSCNGYILKADAKGNEIWRRFVGTALDDVCNGAVQTKAGDYYFTGRVENRESHDFDVMLCKINGDGSYGFMKTYGGKTDDIGHVITQSADGNLVIAGFSENEKTEKENFYAIKCDAEGNLIWEYRDLEATAHTRAYGILPMADGSCLLSGGTAIGKYRSGFESAFVATIDESGHLKAFQPLLPEEGKSYGFDLCQNGQNEFAIVGMMIGPERTTSQPAVFIVNNELELLDYRLVQYPEESLATAILKLADRDFLLAGKAAVENGDYDILISRVQFNTTTSTSNYDARPYVLFPNPMSEHTYLTFPNSPHDKVFTMYTSLGQLVRTMDFKGTEIFIHRENLANGIYYFNVADMEGKKLQTGLLMVK